MKIRKENTKIFIAGLPPSAQPQTQIPPGAYAPDPWF
jgi:hypothetical protein